MPASAQGKREQPNHTTAGATEGGRALVRGVMAALLALLALLVALPAWFLTGERLERLTPSFHVPAEAFQAVQGRVAQDSGEGVRPRPGATGPVVLVADLSSSEVALPRFSRVEVGLDGVDPSARVALIWATGGQRALDHHAPIDPIHPGIDLMKTPDWAGDASAIGVLFGAGVGAQARFTGLDFQSEPPGVRDLYGTLLSGWFDSEGFTQRTINFVSAGGLISPVLVVAGWWVLSVALYLAIGALGRSYVDWRIPVVFFALAWVMLDLRWQFELSAELGETRTKWAGVPAEDRTIPELGGEALLALTSAARAHLSDGARVFINTDSSALGWYAHYRVLPNPSMYRSSFGNRRLRHLQSGDAILLSGGARLQPGAIQGQLPVGLVQQLPARFSAEQLEGSPHPALAQGYYRAIFHPEALDDPQPIRLRVLLRDDSGDTVALADRIFQSAAVESGELSLPFLMTGQGRIEYELLEGPDDVQLQSVTLEAMTDARGRPPQDLGFVSRDQTPPYIIVRLLERSDVGLLVEVQ